MSVHAKQIFTLRRGAMHPTLQQEKSAIGSARLNFHVVFIEERYHSCVYRGAAIPNRMGGVSVCKFVALLDAAAVGRT